jgi:DNA-binding IclR family transcriptional regulator
MAATVSRQGRAAPRKHRTIDRVTRILEEVVQRPGQSFIDLVQTLDASKSTVHSFINGLLAAGWLYEEQRRYYLGPAVYGLTLASGYIRAGVVTNADLQALHRKSGFAVSLGVQAGDHLITIAEAGNDPIAGFDARSNIRRTMLDTAGGKALLAARPEADCEPYLRRRGAQEGERVDAFLEQLADIRTTRLATNLRKDGARFAIATTVDDSSGQPVAAVTLVGATDEVRPQLNRLGKLLLRHVRIWSARSPVARVPI